MASSLRARVRSRAESTAEQPKKRALRRRRERALARSAKRRALATTHSLRFSWQAVGRRRGVVRGRRCPWHLGPAAAPLCTPPSLCVAYTPPHTRPLSAGLALPSGGLAAQGRGHVSTTLLQRPQGEAQAFSRLSLSYLLERPTLSLSFWQTVQGPRCATLADRCLAPGPRSFVRRCVRAGVRACAASPETPLETPGHSVNMSSCARGGRRVSQRKRLETDT